MIPQNASRHISATPMAAGFGAAPPTTQGVVVRDVAERLAGFKVGEAVRIPFRAQFALAEK